MEPDINTNICPVDRMGDLKEQIELMQAEYAELRQQIIKRPTARHGDKFIAHVTQTKVERIDLKRARQVLPSNGIVTVTGSPSVWHAAWKPARLAA